MEKFQFSLPASFLLSVKGIALKETFFGFLLFQQ